MDENSIGKEIVGGPNKEILGDLGGLAREKSIRTSHFSGRSTAAEFKRYRRAERLDSDPDSDPDFDGLARS